MGGLQPIYLDILEVFRGKECPWVIDSRRVGVVFIRPLPTSVGLLVLFPEGVWFLFLFFSWKVPGYVQCLLIGIDFIFSRRV